MASSAKPTAMEELKNQSLELYKEAMAEVTLPTSDEHLTTFHSYSHAVLSQTLRRATAASAARCPLCQLPV
jgi:hypothetical protein